MNVKKKEKNSNRKAFITAGLFMAAAVIGLYWFGTYKYRNVVADPPEDGIIKIYRSYSYDDLCRTMTGSGVLINNRTFLRTAKSMGLENSFKPGRYRLRRGMGNKAIVRMLSHGWQEPVKFSFNGYIRTIPKFASLLSRNFEADSASFVKALTTGALIDSLGFTAETIPGMFIPNTYEFYWTVTPDEFITRMNGEYEKFWKGRRDEKAEAIGMTRSEVSTLASIVIEETKYEPEMPTIAGVYINRLHKGMPLQADPTVKFAVDETLTRILNKHLGVDSPYNTYKHKGLPPGPITIPPVCAIDAVLNYEHHDYLYFCAKSTFNGQHSFAKNYAEHMANAHAYHRALNERERAKKKASE
ncbi:MAG: endolytic transglycosylase MltG [Bacteroidales bacterium]|nr:endolytic transglycosylase MltG [Bacteroidales bacterium]